ncbi:MAG: phage holin family protein [Candidatus Schekmanbacteria bacterium]|nr:phage holin family protein [Candidatus Schekmanbacteria bacterium]
MIELVLGWLVVSAVVLVVSQTVPGVRVKDFGTAAVVALVYGLISSLAYTVLRLLTLGLFDVLAVLTLGLGYLAVNVGALWATDQLVEDFEIDSLGTTALAAVLISIGGWIGKVLIHAIM